MKLNKLYEYLGKGKYKHKNEVFKLTDLMENGRTVEQNILSGQKAAKNRRMNQLEQFASLELIEDYLLKYYALTNDFTPDGILAQNLHKVSSRSFKRWGDYKALSTKAKRNWLSDAAPDIDVLVQELNEQYPTLTIEDVVQFIATYDGRGEYERISELEQSKLAFKRVVGFEPEPRILSEFLAQKHIPNIVETECPF